MTTAGPAMFPRMMQMVGMGDLLQTPEWSTPLARSAPERLDESLAVIVPWMLERTKKGNPRRVPEVWGTWRTDQFVRRPV